MNLFEVEWSPWPATPFLEEGAAVDVWRIDLAATGPEVAAAGALLSEDERARAERFLRARDRDRFVLARTGLRRVLARYGGGAPEEIRFRYGKRGKPELEGTGREGLRFNLSHSAELALCALARGREIGVDLERVRPLHDAVAIAERFFSAREADRVRAAGLADRGRVFLELWTAKEAWLKARGTGLGLSLRSVEVVFGEGRTPRYATPAGGGTSSSTWSLLAFRPATGWVGAVAAEGGVIDARFWEEPGA